jgi:hypothetical protein
MHDSELMTPVEVAFSVHMNVDDVLWSSSTCTESYPAQPVPLSNTVAPEMPAAGLTWMVAAAADAWLTGSIATRSPAATPTNNSRNFRIRADTA